MENVMINLYALSYVITHSTIFHSDDVFGVAMLRLIVPGIKIVRTIKPSEEQLADLATGHAMVFDLGCQFGHPEYDHHQADKALRSDGAPYCGFGLLWRDFGHLLCPSNKAWEKVDRELVLPIDKADNGIERSGLADAIYAFNPTWEEGRAAEDAAFWHAEAFAESVLRRYVETANANVKAEEAVLNSQVVEGKGSGPGTVSPVERDRYQTDAERSVCLLPQRKRRVERPDRTREARELHRTQAVPGEVARQSRQGAWNDVLSSRQLPGLYGDKGTGNQCGVDRSCRVTIEKERLRSLFFIFTVLTISGQVVHSISCDARQNFHV